MSAIWDRCESLTATQRFWIVDQPGAVLSVDTSVKSPLGTGSIKGSAPAGSNIWELYMAERFNPDASLLLDFNVSKPYSVYVYSPVQMDFRVEVITREPDGLAWNAHVVAQRTVPANTMTEIVLDYSDISSAALAMVGEVTVVAYVNNLANPAHVSGLTSQAVAQGTLSIDTSPVKGDVLVDGVSWGIAPQSRTVAAGSHAVSFGPISGYTAPSSATVNVSVNQTTMVTGIYTAAKVTLSVNSTPISSSFTIVIGGTSMSFTTPWSASLDPGIYQVQMPTQVTVGSEVYTFDRWSDGDANPSKAVNLSSDLTLTARYVQVPLPAGVLVVDTAPVRGEILVGGTSQGTAPISLTLSPGIYRVSFGAVVGYQTPASQDAQVVDGQTTSILGTYTFVPPPTTGILLVDTTPVKGEVLVGGASQGVAPVALSIETGSYRVSFGPVGGYLTPPEQTANVVVDQTTRIVGTYAQPPPGTLIVDSTPVKGRVFVDGVLKGTAPVTLTLNPGTYLVSFGTLTDYTAPSEQQAIVGSGVTTQVVGVYVVIPPPPPDTGGIVIDTSPFKAEAFLDGNAVGVTPVTLHDVPVGSHTVAFASIPGFTTPSPVTVDVLKGYMVQVTGEYAWSLPPGFPWRLAIAPVTGMGLLFLGGGVKSKK